MQDVIIIGGGQAGLACGYYLRRSGLSFFILDDQNKGGGAWQQYWESLRLFSPSEHSSLPGWMMPYNGEEYPRRNKVIDYLRQYEERYQLPVKRPVKVYKVKKENSNFLLETSEGIYYTRTVISATGTFNKPCYPDYPGMDKFKGKQLHAADYWRPQEFKDQRVMIVGGGNSAAQILAEVSEVTDTLWVTRNKPEFLPDEVDGRYLFEVASRKYKAKQEGKQFNPPSGGLGDIVMVPRVKNARERGVLEWHPPFEYLTENSAFWPDGSEEPVDVIIWATGFGYALDHLKPLGIVEENGKVETNGTQAVNMPGLWLVGYGGWTGYASATLIGVGRTARQTVKEVEAMLEKGK